MAVDGIKISITHEIKFCLRNGLILTEQEGSVTDAVAYTDRV